MSRLALTGNSRTRSRLAVLSAGGTTPDTILGAKLVTWYDPDNAAGVTVGVADVITALIDLAGNNDLTNGGQPTWVSNNFNGRDIMRFDGVDDYLFMSSAFWFDLTTAEVWIVIKSDESGLGHVLNEGSTGLANYVYRIYDDDPNNDYVFNLENNAGTGRIVNAQDRSTNAWDLVIATDNGAAVGSKLEIVGVDVGTTGAYTRDTPSPALNRFSIGAKITSSPASSFFDGDIAEILILSSAASSGERTLLAAYFNTKFGTSWSPS